MRRGFGLIWVVVSAIIIATVGVFAYQAGWSDGFAQHVPEGTTAVAPYPYYGGFYGPHLFGFGWIFGLLFFLFFLFLIFRVARFAMWGGRGYGRGWATTAAACPRRSTSGCGNGTPRRMASSLRRRRQDRPLHLHRLPTSGRCDIG